MKIFSWARKRLHHSGTWFLYAWFFFFLMMPLLSILTISFSEMRIGSPPYEPLWKWVAEHTLQLRLYFYNYWIVFSDDLYMTAFNNSLIVAFSSTVLCLFLGYPMAYSISRMEKRWQMVCLMLALLPFWTSFLVRVYAWIHLLSPTGLLNHFFMSIGIGPFPLMNNIFSVIVGVVYSYLPFMIFPLYASLAKVQKNFLEAAYDLGCKPRGVFWRITVPLSFPGVIAGSSLVFIPAMGEYIIPEFLGGPTSLTIGRILWYEFFTNRDWPVACALAIVMILLLFLPIFFFEKVQMALERDQHHEL